MLPGSMIVSIINFSSKLFILHIMKGRIWLNIVVLKILIKRFIGQVLDILLFVNDG